eukprot:TRINITY_DN11301_c0_g1_i2.p1 TRINITY_DN11301_c0_g1~~TRINITY_DN11301_c0_g1_i2.p1  ORF type:complete len:215 (-),score=71.68 TRINITY_DN11301_c0_g1_i2:57-701(-)
MFKYFTECADLQLSKVAGRVAFDANHLAVQELTDSEKQLTSSRKGSKQWLEARKKKTATIKTIIDYAKQTQDTATLAAATKREHRLAVHGGFCDALFAVFTVAWIPTRHGFFFWIYHSAWVDADRVIAETGKLGWDPARGLFCAPGVTVNVFLFVLGVFQFLLILWLKDLLVAVHRALFSDKSITEMDGFDVHEADSDDDDEMTQSLAQLKKKE